MERVPQSGQAAAGSGCCHLPALLAMTDHRSLASFIGHYQHGRVPENPPAQLLEEPRSPAAGALTAVVDGGLLWMEVWRLERMRAAVQSD